MGADYYESIDLEYITNTNEINRVHVESNKGYYYFSYDSDSENDYERQKEIFLRHVKTKVLYENNK
jgi:hypothetical protein